MICAGLALGAQETPHPNREAFLSIFPEPLPEGVSQFSFEVSNQFIRGDRQNSPDGRSQTQLQGDDYELVADLAGAAGAGRINLRTRLVYRTEGYSSRLIQNWHDLLEVGDCGRDTLPCIQERYQLTRDGVSVFDLTRPRLELQGLDLAYLLPWGNGEDGGRIGGSVQLPTGGESYLQSSGGVNFMAGVAGWKSFGNLRFWAQGEDLWISLPQASPLRAVIDRGQFWRAWAGVAYQGPGGSFWKGFGLDISLGYNETPYWTQLVRIDKYGLQQTWVFRHQNLPRWRFGFTEKAGTFSAPEITGFVTYRP
jgi:hypothetical protein